MRSIKHLVALNKMRSNIVVAILLIFACQLSHTRAKDYSLYLCTNNRTVTAEIKDSDDNYDCSCKVGPYDTSSMRDDYSYVPGIGSHKLHTEAKSWNDARKVCNDEGAYLAVINSREEEAILAKMLNNSRSKVNNGANNEVAYLGIHDMFKEGEWMTIFGESLYSTGYAHWSSTYWYGQPDNKDNNQNCGALLYDASGLDDVFCHERFAFFCELPLNCS